MNFQIECYPCLMSQAQNTVSLVSDDNAVRHKVMRAVASELASLRLPKRAPEVGAIVHEAIKRAAGVTDPYAGIKKEFNRIAAELADRLRPRLQSDPDPLRTAAKAAIAGNIIDFGNTMKFDLNATLDRVLSTPPFLDDYRQFAEQAEKANSILYLLDNAGEIAFDRLLIEQLEADRPGRVCAAVKSGPIINDATIDDARAVGLDSICRLVETGLAIPGTLPDESSPEFRRLFDEAEMVISKGQGNFETLDDNPRPIFFLFQTKCAYVSRLFNAPEASAILAYKPAGASAGLISQTDG